MSATRAARSGTFFLLLLCLALVVWVGYDLNQSRQRELAAAERSAQTLARVLEGHLRGTSQRIDLLLNEFVGRYQYQVADGVPREQIEPELRAYLEGFPEAHGFRVVGADGNYRYDASGRLPTANIADRSYFQKLRDDPRAGLVISEPLVSKVTGDLVVMFARRLQGRDGQFVGIVFGTLRADYFENYFSRLDLGPGGVVALWSDRNVLFARWPALPEWAGRQLSENGIERLRAEGQSIGVFRGLPGLDGVARIVAFRLIEGFPFVVSVGMAEEDILREWERRAVVYGVLLCLLFGVTAALILSWRKDYLKVNAQASALFLAYESKARESRALLDSIPDPAWLIDTDGRFLAVNEAYCRYLGRSMEQIVGHVVEELFPEDEARRLREGQEEVYRRKEPVRQHVWLRVAGRPTPFEFLRVPVYGEKGEPRGLAGVAWDMSERFEAEERQRLITYFFDHATDAVLILDRERRVLTINSAVTKACGYDLDDLRGQQLHWLLADAESPAAIEAISQSLNERGGWRGELQVRCKDGAMLPVHCNVVSIRDDHGDIVNWAIFVTDLSERKAAEARIHALIHVDQLTGLPNRSGFTAILGEWLVAGQSGILIQLDLDKLGRVNDAFGYEEGDLLLTRMSVRLRQVLREGDALGRLGGDQFGVLAQAGLSTGGIEALARKLLECVAQPIVIDGNEVVATACAGICLLGEDGGDVPTLMRNVDAALHHAKESGQSTFRFFSRDMNVRMAERLRLESDLRSAQANGQLRLHYQPQIDLETGRIVGFESLLRWQHPEFGMIGPDRFIPLAEESRLILPIGAWVLEEACRQCRAWQQDGLGEVVMAVNLSAVQFHSADLVETVEQVLQTTGLDPAWLELEITESVLVQDPEHVVEVMTRLKGLGVSLSLDDFGTGYSSLAYLKRFPLDRIKIDRSFIRDLETDPNDAAIVRMVIGIGAELERRVIAEGVETEEQLRFLRAHGCGDYQGYYFSPPVPAERVPALFQREPER